MKWILHLICRGKHISAVVLINISILIITLFYFTLRIIYKRLILISLSVSIKETHAQMSVKKNVELLCKFLNLEVKALKETVLTNSDDYSSM